MKPMVIGLYGVALFFILRKWYENGNSGLPEPTVLRNPTYLYAILLLAIDVVGGFPAILALGLTTALIWQTRGQLTPVKSVNKTKRTTARATE